jgi:hypothetical protein
MRTIGGMVAVGTICGALGCRGPTPDVQRWSADVAARRDALALTCGGDEASLHALWNGYERLAKARLDEDPQLKLSGLGESLNAIAGTKESDRDDHGSVSVRSAGLDHVFLFASYHCGFYRGGGRLTLLGRVDGRWQSLDRIDVEPELEASLAWTSATRSMEARAVIVASHLGTQFDRSRVTAVRVEAGKLITDREADDLLSLDLSTTIDALVLRYDSLGFPLTLAFGAPRPAYEETWSLGSDAIDVTTRGLTPWLDAVADACRAHQAVVPCHGTLEDAAAVAEDVMELRLSGLDDGPPCDHEATRRDQNAIVRIENRSGVWSIVSVRALDPACVAGRDAGATP